MSEHTKEPWHFTEPNEQDETHTKLVNDAGDEICNFGCWTQYYPVEGDPPSEADARRIVACVNACAGIPTADLEACPDRGLFHLADHANQLVIQRDELLAALEGAEEWLSGWASADPYLTVIRAAIASAKGGAA